ncbi:MAG TPA: DUF4389 domain-containing protein [Acidimicrobiales bacterium]|jgi:roadblock/LC7 domain-containing protein|nr:DUF4389 domain-containing protein [Acidimicrobiales bacterium]
MQATPGTEPVQLSFDAPEKVANWRPLVHWLLGIPHYIIADVLNAVSGVIWIISFFAVLFTESIPEGLFNLQVMIHRYQARVTTYALFMRESYPRFEFTMSQQDPGNDPLGLSIQRPAKVNRWLPLVKWLLAIPHYIVLLVYGIGAIVVVIITFFAVLFTGKYPLGMRDYLVKVGRYGTKVKAYVLFMRDEYPSFALS